MPLKKRLLLPTLLLAAFVSLLSAPASAAPPATANVIQIGAGFRYGFELNEGDFNPWGVGLGLEVGYTLPVAVYLGGNFDYFFGDSVIILGQEFSQNVWQFMAEAGYDFGLGDYVVLRPKLGAGPASIVGMGDSTTNFALAPGITTLLLTPAFSASIDLRYDIIFAEPESLKALILSVGVGF